MKYFIFLSLLLSNVLMAQVEITSGRFYLEINGVKSENYYTQIYKAQAAAINKSIECECEVVILVPDQTVNYIKSDDPVVVEKPVVVDENSPSVVILDNADNGEIGNWAKSSTPGFIGNGSIYSRDIDAKYVYRTEISQGFEYEISVNTTQFNTRTSKAIYEINGKIIEFDQKTNTTGWHVLTTIIADSDELEIVITNAGDGSLLVDDVKIERLEKAVQPNFKFVKISWEYPTELENGEPLKLSDVSHFELQIVDDENVISEQRTPGIARSHTARLDVNKKYRVVVRAVLKNGALSEWSDAVEITF